MDGGPLIERLIYLSFFFYVELPSELFPFGQVNGDLRAPPADDESFGPIQLEVPLILYMEAENTLYVTKGV